MELKVNFHTFSFFPKTYNITIFIGYIPLKKLANPFGHQASWEGRPEEA